MDQKSEIPSIYINFNNFEDFNFIKGNSIYLKLNEKYDENIIISWDEENIKNGQKKESVEIFLGGSSHSSFMQKKYVTPDINFAGNINIITREIIYLKDNIIELPLKENFEYDNEDALEILEIRHLPIKILSNKLSKVDIEIFCGPSRSYNQIEKKIGKDYTNWNYFHTSLVLSNPSINFIQEYKYNNPRIPYPFNFVLENESKLPVFTEDREFEILLSSNAIWLEKDDFEIFDDLGNDLVKDSIVNIEKPEDIRYLNRENIKIVQTPQFFIYKKILKAHKNNKTSFQKFPDFSFL